jgi:hypothetical protein
MDAKSVHAFLSLSKAHIYVTITIPWLYSAKHSVYGRHINYAGALAYTKCPVINGGEILSQTVPSQEKP